MKGSPTIYNTFFVGIFGQDFWTGFLDRIYAQDFWTGILKYAVERSFI
jgi:hypothetical protein